MTIGELATAAAVPTSTLRYYDRIGLVPAERSGGGHRVYRVGALKRVRLVGACQKAGFSLEEIARLLDPSAEPDSWRMLAHGKVAELLGRIEELDDARRMVEAALGCGCQRLDSCDRIPHGAGADWWRLTTDSKGAL